MGLGGVAGVNIYQKAVHECPIIGILLAVM
jgi:hypothetical protein